MPAERIDLQTLLAPEGGRRFAEIAARIEHGAVFIYPTETIYGIGGRYDDSIVYKRILSVKQRTPHRPMILLGASTAQFDPLLCKFPPAARRCAAAFWPGLLTMVLPTPSAPEGIAIRVSNHPFVSMLARFFALPIFSTSANVSGEPYQPDPGSIYRTFTDRVDFMIDAGVLPSSLPSTVVRISAENEVTLVREGRIPAAEIFSVVNQ